MTRLLASVTSLGEAAVALEGGADLIDLKDPATGALGALSEDKIAAVVRYIAGRCPVSATIGDDVIDPDAVGEAVARTAALGVDFVKVGFFPGADGRALARGLTGEAAKGTRIVAVLFADLDPDFTLIDTLGASGFAGAMLDTARKNGGSLRRCLADARLGHFVTLARSRGLLSGLAGSLAEGDIAPLIALGPDYLGFRTALCRRGERDGALDAGRLGAVSAAVVTASAGRPAAPPPPPAHTGPPTP